MCAQREIQQGIIFVNKVSRKRETKASTNDLNESHN